MQVGFYGHVRQYHNFKQQIDEAIHGVLESGKYVMGPAVPAFEQDLAGYFGMKRAVGVNSGTDALWLAFMAMGIGPGDECITVTNTFFATAEAIWIAGAKAVFVDSDPKTKCIDPGAIEAAITPKTKAIVPVHLYGHCADMRAIRQIADKHGLLVIEDNAQSIDGHGPDFKQGELSDAVCTSFIIQKNLGCFGDGGAVVTNRDDVADRIEVLRNHGSPARSCHSMGFNSRLDDIHAATLSVKLKHITEWTDQRRAWAARYREKLAGATQFELPYEGPGYRHVYHLFVVETKDASKRDDLLAHLQAADIDAKCHYPIAIHQQEGYPWGQDAHLAMAVPNSEKNAASCVSLPLYPELTADEVDCVAAKVMEWDSANA